jgi:hypothetical protein
MKLALTLLIAAYSIGLLARSCSLYEVQGKVRINHDQFFLVLAEETASEIKLAVPLTIQGKLAPYIDHTIKVEVTVDTEDLTKSSKLKKITKITRAASDPLNAGNPSLKKEKGRVKCR